MLDCKQSSIDSGATPIGSAVAHPTKKARQLESMLDCKLSNIDSGATPIGSAVVHPIKRRNYGLRPIQANSGITYVLLEGRWWILAGRRLASFPRHGGWHGARCLGDGVGLRVLRSLLHDRRLVRRGSALLHRGSWSRLGNDLRGRRGRHLHWRLAAYTAITSRTRLRH